MHVVPMIETLKSKLKRPVSQRVGSWVAFLSLASAVLMLVLPGYLQRVRGWRTRDVLESALASDGRFQKVRVLYATNGSVNLDGRVDSEADLAALHSVVVRQHSPRMLAFHVIVAVNTQ
jgi:hypothetical protein